MGSISPNPPRETLALISQSPTLPRYLPILQIFKIIVFSNFLGEIIIKFAIKYTKNQPHCDSFSRFLLMAPPSRVHSAIF